MDQTPTTPEALLRQARARIEANEASMLLAHVLGRTPAWLYAHGGDAIPGAEVLRFHELVERRAAGEPVAYLTGRRGFWTLDLAVTPDTLIPRPETELLVELALERVADGLPVRTLDMGTGSGAIALALARERPGAEVTATDRSAAALEVARRNAHDHDIGNVRFALGDWYQPVRGMRFGLIASNPPYIADGDGHLERGDLRFEPAGALASGGDGLDALRVIAAGAREHLQPGGWLLVEHGLEQGPAVRALFAEAGLEAVETARDLEDRERVTLGRLPGAG
jgi:release factor glutamine methyltransferase